MELINGPVVYARENVCCTLYKIEVNVCNGVVNAIADDAEGSGAVEKVCGRERTREGCNHGFSKFFN